jgi:hypothetical protein
MSVAYASSDTDPFEYTYNGKILTKPYIEEIDRLMRLGYRETDECVNKLIRKLTLVINPLATELLPMTTINFARNTIRGNNALKKYIFNKQEKARIDQLIRLIEVYKKMGKELTEEMKVVEKAFDTDGKFNIDLINLEEYYAIQYNKS